ncbi:MAG: hypothetical protein RM022_033110 [Nostoc sp. EfeVER01]|uniref:hypothetical protein n=1 Tax=Nostoc sp. EfeVER01 TaxID=3075406 RepID=UPI00391B7BAD
MEIPHFLTISQYHLSRKDAEESVTNALKQCGYHKPSKKSWGEIEFTINENGQSIQVKFHELVKKARLTGIALESLQKQIDNADEVFGKFFSFATPNHQLSINTSYAGYSKELKGPCRISPVEDELTEDILFYRQQVCMNSNSDNFTLSCRYYRAYILSCLSLIDAFLNRHILFLKFTGFSSPDFHELENKFNIEDKIDLWLKVFAGKNISVLNKTKEWNHFKLLKEERNMLTHAVEPFYGHQIKEVANYLNYVSTGIGGLLSLLIKARKLNTLGFMKRLITSPKVTYNEITLRAD